ncbi:hypothetical protein FQN54_001526 [Arachnomyces sp. PD_36]|nr:hypothetical protein FQN54_001526 [Arachnomyces sp. PD_36]
MIARLPFFQQLLLWTYAASALTTPLKADIRADSNRDGTVDIHGTSDLQHKHEWSNTAGAIFLANIGDTDRRCSKLAQEAETPLSNEELAACNDASDNIQRAPQFMAPLRTVPIPGIRQSAIGRVLVEDEVARGLVRIFRQEGDDWVFTTNEYEFSAEELRDGLELGIDARDTRRPEVWDGRVSVRFEVLDGETVTTDFVNLRVAPVLTHHHAQRTLEVISTDYNGPEDIFQKDYISNLTHILGEEFPELPLFLFEDSYDLWAQDFLEPGYTSMPGPNNETIALQVMIRSAQDSREAGRLIFEQLRDTGRGAVYYPGGPRDGINDFGNLETIPPYTHNGKEYPAGRIYQGTHGPIKPYMLPYFQAQELQDPILLDTNWLSIGHVDEFLTFHPFPSPRGWIAIVADPHAALDILTEAQRLGHGNVRAFSRLNDTRPPPPFLDGIPGGIDHVPEYTINDLLSDTHILSANENFTSRITSNLNIIKNETGLSDSEIYRLPTLFRTGLTFPPGAGFGPERNGSSVLGSALYPSGVNGVVFSETEFLAPKTWGPVIGGRDILAEGIKEVYGRVGYNVRFIDNWYSHHKWGGEVHCGTNTRRDGSEPWW